MRKALFSVALIAISFLTASTAFGQNVSGKIIRAATLTSANDILDPAAFTPPGYTSKSTLGFQGDDVGNAKLGFKGIPTFSTEPFGDLRRGPDHLYSDFVPDAAGNGVYMYFDGTNLLFRMRLGSIVPGAKGYSILIDTDLKFGNSGPNADANYLPATTGVNGNPGFEREILLSTGGTRDGVYVYNIDGVDNVTTTNQIHSATTWMAHSQISIAGTNDNGDPDFFLDFYIPLTALGGGITASTPLRFNATTVMSGQSAIGGPKSDIYGLNDDAYKSTNAQWEAYINQQPPITLTSLSGTGTTPTSTTACTGAPQITNVTTSGGTNSKGVVTGTWTKLSTSAQSSAIITVYQNGTALTGTVSATTGGTWTYNIPASITLTAGQTITATAVATGESQCLTSNGYMVYINTCTNWSSANLVAPIGDNSNNNYQCFLSATGNTTPKGVGAVNRTNSTWVVYVNEAISNNTRNSTTDQGQAFFSSSSLSAYSTTTWTQSATPYWKYSDGCQGGSNLTNGVYTFWYQDGNGCKSDITPVCVGTGNGTGSLAGTISIQPTISPSTVTPGTTSVTVTGAAGTTISLYYNGEVIGTSAISGTYNGTTTGTISFSNLSFSSGGVLSALSQKITSGSVTTSYCPSKSAAQIIPLCTTTAPVIDADVNGQITAGQPITGGSSEPAGTTIRVYNSVNTLLATTTVLSNGSWTTSGATFSNSFTGNAVAGAVYYATAQNGSCTVSASSGTVTAATATTNVCGTITSTVDETSTSVSGNLSTTPAATTTITLYQDGISVATTTTPSSNWMITGIAAGTFNPNSILSISIRQGTNQEVLCPNTSTVVCASQPTAPVIVSPSNPTITSGSTVTYTLSNITSGNFYGIVDANSGKSMANGVWATSNSNISITTYPFTGTAGTVYNIQVKVSSVSSTAVCTNRATGNVTLSSILPARFLSLSALKLSTGANVLWSVTDEQKVAFYSIERSNDCVNYTSVGQVPFKNSTDVINQYSFIDPGTISGVVCYRVKQVDLDGRAHYSNIVTLKMNNSFSVQVAPNPANTKAVIYIATSKEENISLQLIDFSGKVHSTKTISIHEGSNSIPLHSLGNLARGNYIVKINTSDGVFYQKLLLQ